MIFYFLLKITSFLIFCQQDIKTIAKDYESIISSFSNRVAVIYFESTDGIPRDGIIFTEKLVESLVKNSNLKVVDPMVAGLKFKNFGIKNLGDINQDNYIKILKEIGTDIFIIGSVSRIGDVIEIRGRIIKAPQFDILNILTHEIFPIWDGGKKIYPSKKFISTDVSNFKPTPECKYPELIKIASEKEVSKYSFSCVDFSCKIIDCSKYPTVKNNLFKIYFQDPLKTVIVTDDSFNILEEYTTK
ncbi:MAG: hypothetical protein N2Z20_03615 [Elusimicrobiales bacterium]|nr:hypothetical protein [Elusimicrobiales bacterium]